ncbi:MAG: DUF1573 domain-containing protein [Pirellulaceae bacterium]
MLAKFSIGLAVVFGLLLLFLVTIVGNARFTMPHPRDPKVKVLLLDRGAIAMPTKKVGATSSDANFGIPKVEVVEKVFHFGRMDPQTSGKHSFEVRNIGTAPLTLSVAGTTCKCTVGGVSANEVPPGEKAFVTLEWNTGYKFQTYSQSAEVRTNDPTRPVFSLEVEGKVRRLFGSEEEELVVPAITPGKPATAEVIVFSQIWDDLEIIDIKTTLPGIAVQFLPVDSGELKRLDAKSARLLKVTVPGDLPAGEFRDAIRIRAATPASAQVVAEFELPLRGKTLKMFTINGPFNENDFLLLGQVPQGAGKTLRLMIKLRDEDLSLPIQSIEAEPSYLKIAVEPHQEADLATPGLYDLIIEVPADAPVGQYMGNPHGSLRISTGHPRVPEIKLKLLMAVTP